MGHQRDAKIADSSPLVRHSTPPADPLPAPSFRARWRPSSRLFLSHALHRVLVAFAVLAPAALIAHALGWIPAVPLAHVTLLRLAGGVAAALVVVDTALDFAVGGTHAVLFSAAWWVVLGGGLLAGCGWAGVAYFCVFAVHAKLVVVWVVHGVSGWLVVPAQLTFGGAGGGWSWASAQSSSGGSGLAQWRQQLREQLQGESVCLLTPDNIAIDAMWFAARPPRSSPAPCPSPLAVPSRWSPHTPHDVLSPSWRDALPPPDQGPLSPPGREGEGEGEGESGGEYENRARQKEWRGGEGPKGDGVEKAVVLFNSNNEAYELKSEEVAMFLERGWAVLVFNYRGVERSKGWAHRDGLVLDGDTCYQYVRQVKRAPEHGIVLMGTSLGGAVATEVARLHPHVSLINDRSFSSLRREIVFAVPSMLEMPEGSVKGWVVGRVVGTAACFIGWELNAAASWPHVKGNKLLVFHDKDFVIPPSARLCNAVNTGDALTRVLRLDEGVFESAWGDADDHALIAHGRGMTASEQHRFFAIVNAFCQ